MLKGYTFSSRHDFGCNPYFVIYWMFINILKNISSNFHREMFFDSQIIDRNVIQFLNILKISTYYFFFVVVDFCISTVVRENAPYDFNTLIIVETCFPDQYFIKVLHEPEKNGYSMLPGCIVLFVSIRSGL